MSGTAKIGRTKFARGEVLSEFHGPMLRSRRLLIAAIIGLAILNPVNQNSSAHEAPANSPDPPKAEQKPVDLRPIQDALDSLTSAVKSLKDNPESEAENKRAQSDLKAQQDMANWAFWMFVATAATVFLTFVGVLLIWRTLVHTRDAAKSSAEMADQAIVASNAAVDAAKAADLTARAMIGMETPIIRPINAHDFFRETAGVVELKVKDVYFRNYGRTPAFPMTLFMGIHASSERPPKLPLDAVRNFPGNSVIQPEPMERAFCVTVNRRTSFNADEFRSGKIKVWLDGRMHYVDFMNNLHDVEFLWKLHVNSVGEHRFVLERCVRSIVELDHKSTPTSNQHI